MAPGCDDWDVGPGLPPLLRTGRRTADLVVVGSISAVREGFSISSPEGLWEQRTTVIVTVDEVIAGTPASQELTLQLARSPLTGVGELAETLPNGQALFILEDITDWTPFPGALFEYPAGLSDATTIYSPYPDGIWFATDATPVGYFASFDEITTRWSEVADFADLVDAFRRAASDASSEP